MADRDLGDLLRLIGPTAFPNAEAFADFTERVNEAYPDEDTTPALETVQTDNVSSGLSQAGTNQPTVRTEYAVEDVPPDAPPTPEQIVGP